MSMIWRMNWILLTLATRTCLSTVELPSAWVPSDCTYLPTALVMYPYIRPMASSELWLFLNFELEFATMNQLWNRKSFTIMSSPTSKSDWHFDERSYEVTCCYFWHWAIALLYKFATELVCIHEPWKRKPAVLIIENWLCLIAEVSSGK